MKSALAIFLLFQFLFTNAFLSSALAVNTIQVSPHEGNKIATVKIFKSRYEAEKFAEKLKSEGFLVDLSESLTKDKELIYRVSGKKQMDALKEELSSTCLRDDEKLFIEKGNELKQEETGPLVIFYPRERTEFRNVNEITFLWREIPRAARYHVILAKDRNFTDIIHENSNVTRNSYAIEGLNYGTYFFRVLSRLSDNTQGPSSDTLSFIIGPPKPSKLPLYFIEPDT